MDRQGVYTASEVTAVEPTTLRIMQLFIRALSHRIRTPLNTLLNDLSSIELAQGESEETTRGLRQVEYIAGVLNDAALMQAARAQVLTDCTVIDFFTEAFPGETAAKALSHCIEEGVSIVPGGETTNALASLLAHHFSEHSLSLTALDVNHFAGAVTELNYSAAKTDIESSTKEVSSFSLLFCELLGVDSVTAPLLDVITKTLGIETKLSSLEGQLNVSMNFSHV